MQPLRQRQLTAGHVQEWEKIPTFQRLTACASSQLLQFVLGIP
ncbi:MAG TPA: hypothetical protein PLV87_17040 [Opitutaceae bacterium]|nr:hypothetical protein [Opitutaceae bacterium]